MRTVKVAIIPVENCGLSLLDSQVNILAEIWLWNPCKTYYGQEEKEAQRTSELMKDEFQISGLGSWVDGADLS